MYQKIIRSKIVFKKLHKSGKKVLVLENRLAFRPVTQRQSKVFEKLVLNDEIVMFYNDSLHGGTSHKEWKLHEKIPAKKLFRKRCIACSNKGSAVRSYALYQNNELLDVIDLHLICRENANHFYEKNKITAFQI